MSSRSEFSALEPQAQRSVHTVLVLIQVLRKHVLNPSLNLSYIY